jgi:hypothetical protein
VPVIDNGCRFGHQCQWRESDLSKTQVAVKWKIYMVILRINTKYSLSALGQPLWKRLPALDQVDPSIPRHRKGKRLRNGGDVCRLLCWWWMVLSVLSSEVAPCPLSPWKHANLSFCYVFDISNTFFVYSRCNIIFLLFLSTYQFRFSKKMSVGTYFRPVYHVP